MNFNTNELKKLLIAHEGMEFVPYKDSKGILTVGVGHNMEARPLPYRLQALLDVGGSLSVEDCSELLDIDIAIVLVDMNRFNWFEGLSYARKTALCDMVYNLGLSRFMGFKKLIAALSEGDYDTAATEMLRSKWAVDVGHNRSTTLSEIVRTDEL